MHGRTLPHFILNSHWTQLHNRTSASAQNTLRVRKSIGFWIFSLNFITFHSFPRNLSTYHFYWFNLKPTTRVVLYFVLYRPLSNRHTYIDKKSPFPFFLGNSKSNHYATTTSTRQLYHDYQQ